MANIFDYLKDVAYDSYYDLPLNELDILTLIESPTSPLIIWSPHFLNVF